MPSYLNCVLSPKNARTVISAATVSIAFLLGSAASAVASCYAGTKPGWTDVAEIRMTVCQPTNAAYPCYSVAFAPRETSLDGYLVAYRFENEQNGRYVLPKNANYTTMWGKILALLKRSDFYDLEIMDPTPGPTFVLHIDSPANEITLKRCHTSLTIALDSSYDKQSEGFGRFTALVNDLAVIVQSLSWQKTASDVTVRDVVRNLLP